MNQIAPTLQRTATRTTAAAPAMASDVILDMPRIIERIHRRFLDIVRAEISRIGADDLNPVQAMQLLDIDDDMSVQELIDRGHYIGSNALYNIRKLAQSGFVESTRSPTDKRALRVRRTDKGREICRKLRERLLAVPVGSDMTPEALLAAFRSLRTLERAWDDHIRYGR
jgi:DNA-binding MarR family transcriptional regulator